MNYKLLAVAASSMLVVATSSMANTTMVGCPGYTVSVSDDVAIKGQALAGTTAAFNNAVCERSSEMAKGADTGASVIPVYIEDLSISTRVVIFKHEND